MLGEWCFPDTSAVEQEFEAVNCARSSKGPLRRARGINREIIGSTRPLHVFLPSAWSSFWWRSPGAIGIVRRSILRGKSRLPLDTCPDQRPTARRHASAMQRAATPKVDDDSEPAGQRSEGRRYEIHKFPRAAKKRQWPAGTGVAKSANVPAPPTLCAELDYGLPHPPVGPCQSWKG